MPAKKLIVRCKEYFKLQPGQKLNEFLTEFKKLSERDKKELCDLLNEEGFETTLK